MSGFKRLTISGWRQFKSVDIELHPRLTILTGANGAGKSTLLSFFSRHFGFNRALLATPISENGATTFSFGNFGNSRETIATQGPSIGSLQYEAGGSSTLNLPASSGSGINYQVNIVNQQDVEGTHVDSHRPPNVYRHGAQISLNTPASDALARLVNSEIVSFYTSGNVSVGSLHHIKMALIQMSIFGHGNSTMEPVPALLEQFKGFELKLREMFPKSLGFERLVIRAPEILLITKSGSFLIDAASGGLIKIFEIAWQLYFYSRGKSRFVVTIDEPENHLHPSMQRTLLPNLLSAFPEAQFIVATHSPFVISAMKDSSVYVLRYENTEVHGSNPTGFFHGVEGFRVVAERLDTVNKAGTASEVLRDVLGVTATIPDWAESRVDEILGEYLGKAITEASLDEIFRKLQAEGLATSYPLVVQRLARSE